MSDEEHSESEFYYPEVENEEYETDFYQFNEVYNPTTVASSETARKKLTKFLFICATDYMPYNKKLTDFDCLGCTEKYLYISRTALTLSQ